MIREGGTLVVRTEGKSEESVTKIRREIALFYHEQGIEPSIVQTDNHLFIKVNGDVLFPRDRLKELLRLK